MESLSAEWAMSRSATLKVWRTESSGSAATVPSLYWLITGKTIGGLSLYSSENRFDREEALKLYTLGSSWFSTENGKKGALAPGQLADFAVLSADYFSIPEEEIKQLESQLTVVG